MKRLTKNNLAIGFQIIAVFLLFGNPGSSMKNTSAEEMMDESSFSEELPQGNEAVNYLIIKSDHIKNATQSENNGEIQKTSLLFNDISNRQVSQKFPSVAAGLASN